MSTTRMLGRVNFESLARGAGLKHGGVVRSAPAQTVDACAACSGDGYDMSGCRCHRCGGTKIEPQDARSVTGRRV